MEIARVPPPVPDCKATGWHYHTLKTLPDEYKNVDMRKPDDFCPRAQLRTYVDSCGDPEIATRTSGDGTVTVYDRNDTFQKIMTGLPDLIAKYTGSDFDNLVKKEAGKM